LIPHISNKRILFCSSFTPPVNAGGGKNAFNFAKFLSEKGLKVTLLTLNRRGKLPHRELVGSLKIIRILYFNYNIITKIFSLLIILPNYFYYVFRNNIIFIYGGNIIAFEFIIFVGKLLRKEVIFQSTLLGDDDIQSLVRKGIPRRVLRKKILSLISQYFSLNPEFTKSWLNVYKVNTKVFESTQGVNTKIFHPVTKKEKLKIRNKLKLPINSFIMVSVGFLINRKGFREIFEVLNQLNVPFLYIIVGDYKITETHYLYNHAREMEKLFRIGKDLLRQKVLFAGPKENVNEYLQSADIFLLNSKIEGIPNALLEAMACGITPFVRNIKGVNEFLTFNETNAFVYNTREEFIIKIKEAFRNDKKRKHFGEKSIKLIQKDSTFEVLYDKLIQNKN